MVLVAFRTGLHVTKMGETLEASSELTKGWTYVVPEISEDLATSVLAEFNTSHVITFHPLPLTTFTYSSTEFFLCKQSLHQRNNICWYRNKRATFNS